MSLSIELESHVVQLQELNGQFFASMKANASDEEMGTINCQIAPIYMNTLHLIGKVKQIENRLIEMSNLTQIHTSLRGEFVNGNP